MPSRKCFLCGNKFQFGPQTYLGMQVKAWDIMVCNDCHASQRGGIVPARYPHLVEHLKTRGISPDHDDHGWIRWPLERHANHKFVVGQKVGFRPDMGQLANRGETFVIVRQLPEAAGMPQYEIRSEADGHARVVREAQLADL